MTLLYGPRYFAPLRYLALFLRTIILLAVQNPDIVYAQNPPVFCPLSSLLYCRARGKRLVIDHHSVWKVKTIGGAVGRAIGFLEAFVSSSANLNTAPHGVWAKELLATGARKVLVVRDFVDRNPFARDQVVRENYGRTPLIAIASHGGHPLERLETEVRAAASVSELTLLVTGPPSKLSRRMGNLPPNVKFLGMLPMDDYLRLKASCDFAVNITDEPYTLSHVIFECVASSLPVLSSRQDVVVDTFGDSLVYVKSSSPEDVASALSKLARNPGYLEDYARRAREVFERLRAGHDAEASELRKALLQ